MKWEAGCPHFQDAGLVGSRPLPQGLPPRSFQTLAFGGSFSGRLPQPQGGLAHSGQQGRALPTARRSQVACARARRRGVSPALPRAGGYLTQGPTGVTVKAQLDSGCFPRPSFGELSLVTSPWAFRASSLPASPCLPPGFPYSEHALDCGSQRPAEGSWCIHTDFVKAGGATGGVPKSPRITGAS